MTDVGDLLTPTLTVSPHDGTTAATLVVTAPDGTVTAGTGETTADVGATWTADDVTLNQAGMWVFGWTVTGTGQGVEYSTVVVNLAPTAIAFTPPLAGMSDLILRAGELTEAQQARAYAVLADASALVRSYTGQTFTAVEGDVVELRPVGMRIRLPQRPVTDITSVVAIGWGGVADFTLPLGAWGWDGIDIIELTPYADSNTFINLPEVDLYGSYPDTYRITYDHGEESVPEVVVAIVCGIALRTLFSPSMVEGMTSEHIGQYSYQLGQFAGGAASGTAVRLTEADKEALAPYKRRATTVQLRI